MLKFQASELFMTTQSLYQCLNNVAPFTWVLRMFLWHDMTSTTFRQTTRLCYLCLPGTSRYNVTKLLKFMYFLLQILSRKYWLPSALKFHDSENNMNAGSVFASIHITRVCIELWCSRMFGKTACQPPPLPSIHLYSNMYIRMGFIYNVFTFSYVLQSLCTCILE